VRAALIVIAAALLLIGGICVVAGGRSISDEWRFARNGVSTDATILTKEIKHSRYRARRYEATYRFVVPEGVYESRTQLSYDAWMRLTERQPAEALYLPERPATSRLTDPQRRAKPVWTALLGGVFLMVGAVFLRRSIRTHRLTV
jgi:hypothetical protein